MKQGNKLIALIVSLLLASFLVFLACAPKPAPPAAPKPSLKISWSTDVTGPAAGSCIIQDKAVEYYVKDINEKKGGVEGHRVEFRSLDDGFDAARSIANYKILKDWGALMIGQLHTKGAVAAKGMNAADKIPGITNSMSAASVYPPGYLYCHYGWVTDGAFVALKWIWENWDVAKQGKLKLAIWSTDEPMGRFNALPIKKYAGVLGKGDIEVVTMQYFPLPVVDVAPQVNATKAAAPHWVLLNFMSPGPTPLILKGAKQIGYAWKVMGQSSCLFHMSVGPAEGAVEGCYTALFWGQPEEKGWGIDLAKELWTTYDKKPLDELTTYAWEDFLMGMNQAMIMVKALESTIKDVGYDKLTGEAIKVNGLDKMNIKDTGGINPGISYVDYPGDRVGIGASRIVQVKGTTFIPLTKFMPHVPESRPENVIEWAKP